MGKVRSSVIKNLSRRIMSEYGDYITIDYQENKKFLDMIVDLKTKTFRNRVAGYITRLKLVEGRKYEIIE
ncbi:MAG: 30S ribosomal protein S17e [Candidatus Hodarchaeales archaeon]